MGRARLLGAQLAYSSYEQVLQDPLIDVVYISLHNSAHVQWCANALSAGKHVLCEKPLAMTASEVAELADLAASTGKLLVEAMWVRWHPRMQEVRNILGLVAPIGVRRVDVVFEGPEPRPGNYRLDPALGGGALLDLGCYAMATLLEVFDWEIPTVLDAELRCGPRGADASARVELQFAGGTASVHVALTGCRDQRLRIDAGCAALEFSAPVFTSLDEESDVVISSASGETRRIRYPACNPYRTMVESVADAVRGEASWVMPLAESYAVAATLDAVRTAARTLTEEGVEVHR
jgi:predicted dehydrogenase